MITDAEWTKLCDILMAVKYLEIECHRESDIYECRVVEYTHIRLHLLSNARSDSYIRIYEIDSMKYDTIDIQTRDGSNIKTGNIQIWLGDNYEPIIIFPLVMVSDCRYITDNIPGSYHYVAQIHPPDTFDLKPTNKRIEL